MLHVTRRVPGDIALSCNLMKALVGALLLLVGTSVACSTGLPRHSTSDAESQSPATVPNPRPSAAGASTGDAGIATSPQLSDAGDPPQKTWSLPQRAPEPVFTSPLGIELSGSDVFVVGGTNGALPNLKHHGEQDAFLVRLGSADGRIHFAQQFGTSTRDVAHDVRASGDHVYVVGATGESLDAQLHRGMRDAFVQRRKASDGGLIWSRQFGTPKLDEAQAATVDRDGFIIVAGTTAGQIDSRPHLGQRDVFVQRYSPDGALQWTTQLGGAGDDSLEALRLDSRGRVQVLSSHVLGPLEPTPDGYGFTQRGMQSLVVLLPGDGAFVSGIRFASSGAIGNVLVNGARIRLTEARADRANDFAVTAEGDWLLATSEYQSDGTCPSHDGYIPSVQRMNRVTGRSRWEQTLDVTSFSSLMRHASCSLSEVERGVVFEAGVAEGAFAGVYLRKLRVQSGDVAWHASFEGYAIGDPIVARAGEAIVSAWQNGSAGNTAEGHPTEPALVRRFQSDTGQVLWSSPIAASPSIVEGAAEPGSPVEFCGSTYPGDAAETRIVCRSPKDVVDLTPLRRLPNLTSLHLSKARVANLDVIAELGSLRWLTLDECEINNLAAVGKLRGLRKLSLTKNQFRSLEPLASLANLEELNLSGNELRSLAPLGALPTLRTLELSRATFDSLEPLRNLPKLEKLRLVANRRMDLSPLAVVRSLQYLDLSWSRDTSLEPLHQMSQLRFVDLTALPKEQVVAVVAALPHLRLWDTEPEEEPTDSAWEENTAPEN